MTDVRPARQAWIDESCRRFSVSTGWPIRFRQRDEFSSETILSPAAGGALCVELPEGYEHDPQWPAVRQLTHLLSEFINRVLSLESRETHCEQTAQRMTRFTRAVSQQVAAGEAIPHLLQTAVEMCDVDGTAFFLLNPDEPELNLRARWSPHDMPLATTRRPLAGESPDLQVMIKGPRQNLRSDFPAECHWLPAGWQMGACFPVRSGTQPIGTFWTFFRRERTLDRTTLDLLQSLAGLLSIELERTVLTEESRDRTRLRKEIHAASRHQQSGNESTTIPTWPFDLAIRLETREEIGGDLCEVIALDADRTLLVLGDATGDGIPAAIIRARLEGALLEILHSLGDAPPSTAVIASRLNATLNQMLADDQFCSLFLGLWDRRRRTLACTNAGHPAPLLVRGGELSEIKSHGMLLGILPESEYRETVVELAENDLLILCSDGVSDALTHGLGTPLPSVVRRQLRFPLAVTAERMAAGIWNQLTGDNLIPDDRCLMVVRFTASPVAPPAAPTPRESVPAPHVRPATSAPSSHWRRDNASRRD